MYFDCFLDTAAIRERFDLSAVVEEHSHRGTHDGRERGLVCTQCRDAIMGLYEPAPGKEVFAG